MVAAPMPEFLDNLLQILRGRRGTDMQFVCRRLLSESGEASQTVLAQKIIDAYKAMGPEQRCGFFDMLSRDFSPDSAVIARAAAAYAKSPDTKNLSALSAAVEPPRQELFRRINTTPCGIEFLLALREHLLELPNKGAKYQGLDDDLRHLFRSWFNRGFLRLERISWRTSAVVLEKLINYESVHEISGWPDLRRRLEADRRCFAFFHPALADEPIIFVEVALAKGLRGDLEPLLSLDAPVISPKSTDTAIFYSINNCLRSLRNIPFGNLLIKQVLADLTLELPNIRNYGTLSPLPRFSQALTDAKNEEGLTPGRLSRLLAEFAPALTAEGRRRDSVEAFFHLLENPVQHRNVLRAPLQRVALAYLTLARLDGRLYDPVATFHLSNGARLDRVNPFANLRPYGLKASYGVTVNYRYLPAELEQNHERFVRSGDIRLSHSLVREHKAVMTKWVG
jgi:malonyl-CoA decarboxylase